MAVFILALTLYLGSPSFRPSYARLGAGVLYLLLVWVSVGLAEHMIFDALGGESGLWGAPIHLVFAAALPVGVFFFS